MAHQGWGISLPGASVGEMWVRVTAPAKRQAAEWGNARCSRRWADDLLFIDVGRGSETGAAGRAAPRSSVKKIPLQSCQRNTICHWQSLRVPWLYEHVDMPQKQLLLRAWNAAHFSNTDTAEFYLSVPWWLQVFFTVKDWNDALYPLQQEQFPLVILGHNSGINLVQFIYWNILSLVNHLWKLEL